MELIAQGRDADVFALGGGKVLRRYRLGGPTEREARLMRELAGRGYPVPEVYESSGSDLVMERLDGPTMLEELERRPWRVRALGRELGRLHDRLHAVPAPAWLPRRFTAAGGDDRVLHLDLHPGNVVLTGRGPVVIDWRSAAAGDPAADLAMTVAIVAAAEISGTAVRLGRGLWLRGLRKGSRSDPSKRIREVATARLDDPNVTPAEAEWLRRRAGVQPR